MQEIVDKYENSQSEFLLPIIKHADKDNRLQYQSILRFVNNHLKSIVALLNVEFPISMYTARHSWASIARSKNIPISVISEGMGHDSEMTTQIYLATLDNAVVDKANAQILKDL